MAQSKLFRDDFSPEYKDASGWHYVWDEAWERMKWEEHMANKSKKWEVVELCVAWGCFAVAGLMILGGLAHALGYIG